MIAPRSCAQAASFSIGLIVPSEFETRFAATTLTAALAGHLVEQVHRSSPWSSIGIIRNSAPVRFAICCHGTKFEWCSSSVTRTRVARAEVVEPPRVGDEVQPLRACRTKMHSRVELAFRNGPHLLARALVPLSCPLGQRIDAAVTFEYDVS
jgi:hypothetical protein